MHFQSTEADLVTAHAHHQRRLLRRWGKTPSGRLYKLVGGGIWGGLLGLAAVMATTAHHWEGAALGAGVVCLLVLSQYAAVKVQRAYLRFHFATQRQASAPTALAVLEEGLNFHADAHTTLIGWPAIRAVEEAQGGLLIYLSDVSYSQVPASAFAEPGSREALIAGIERHTGLKLGITPTRRPSRRSPLVRGLLQGLRLALFLPPDREENDSWGTLLALVFAGLVVACGSALLSMRFDGVEILATIAGPLFALPLTMLAAVALCRLLARDDRSPLPLLIAFAGLQLVIELMRPAIQLLHQPLLEGWLPVAWLTVAACAGALRLYRAPVERWFIGLAVCTLALGLPAVNLALLARMWQPDAVIEKGFEGLSSEEVFYLQPKLLEDALAKVEPGVKGKTEVYFVGFAGDAWQDVFMKEVTSVGELFADRFGAAGRSVELINNAKTMRDFPVASATSLERTLARVGERMNRDEDVLFLFITSHGSREHGASIQFWPLEFDDLDPSRLKRALDASGIRNRIVVVSACYSGTFVDALKDEDTLVITASAADRTSFGCSDTAEFTDFSRAYFKDALARTSSFSAAFSLAKTLIAQRETQARERPSNPQMYEGERIRPLIDRLAVQFRRR